MISKVCESLGRVAGLVAAHTTERKRRGWDFLNYYTDVRLDSILGSIQSLEMFQFINDNIVYCGSGHKRVVDDEKTFDGEKQSFGRRGGEMRDDK